MSVTCHLSGRLGNIWYNLAMLIAYSKKHNLQYYIPTWAPAYAHFGESTTHAFSYMPSIGTAPVNPSVYQEQGMATGPFYYDIPYMDNVVFDGYFQSFKYCNDYRQAILDAFNLPHNTEHGIVAIGVRRGDNVTEDRGETDVNRAFPLAPMIYYHRAVEYMQKRGHNRFRIYSDDNPWCREEFTEENYPGAIFEFYEGTDILQKYTGLTNCEHQICARSSFDLTAAWMNQNPNKIVLVPQENMWWKGQNKDLLTDSGFTQIYFPQEYNIHMMKYYYDYKHISFALIIQNYWKDIYRGQLREALYSDYCKMLELVEQIDKSRYILDVGVNHSIFAVPASMLGYKVIGFEPVEVNFDSIRLAAIENNLTNFHVTQAALSDVDGEIDIYVPECSDNASLNQGAAISNMVRKDFYPETVKTINFDNWIKDKPEYTDIGLIKLDVQGAEYKVITGMRAYLTQAHNLTVICEYEHHLVSMGSSFEQLDNLFYELGFEFRGYLIPNDKIFYKP